MTTKEWGSILGDALNESSDVREAIIGGLCAQSLRAAVERWVSDHNYLMPTCDAIDLAFGAAGTDWIEEMGGLAEVTASHDNLASLAEAVASGAAYRLVMDATEEALTDLIDVIEDVEADGYEVWAMGTGSSNLGWLPHQSESDEYGGCLCYWRRPEGGPDAWQLHLTIGDTRVWFSLSREVEETDNAA